MCGIFGFVLRKPISMTKVFQILKKLENSKQKDEEQPLGGYGAGLAIMLPDGNIISEKIGKTSESPAAQLEKIMEPTLKELKNACVLIGHVRFPSPENMSNVKCKEAAQPYVEHFDPQITIVSAHNGKIQNSDDLRKQLKTHVFESTKVGFVDSEIIPHYFGELLNETEDADAAVYDLLASLKGSSAAALLQVDQENALLHLIHRGKTRGLTVWTNNKNEVIFCSRPEPVVDELSTILESGKFQEKVSIKWKEDAGLKLSFSTMFE